MATAMQGGEALRLYRQSMTSMRPLDREIERELARKWRDGDQRAGERIVEACLPFVVSIAIEYRRWGIPIEDIIQQGNVGLLRAAKKFDPEREVRLATYAAYWIRAEIREYVVRAFRVVRIGTTKAERRALRAYRTTQTNDVPTLAKVSGLSEARVEQILPLLQARETSLDATHGDLPAGVERLVSTSPSPEEDVEKREVAGHTEGAVREALSHLNERERMIVLERMMTDDPPTLQALGERLGVSKERVRQLEERAKIKLRAELRAYAELARAS
jgi:RNA polymerase sigma-32 factor